MSSESGELRLDYALQLWEGLQKDARGEDTPKAPGKALLGRGASVSWHFTAGAEPSSRSDF